MLMFLLRFNDYFPTTENRAPNSLVQVVFVVMLKNIHNKSKEKKKYWYKLTNETKLFNYKATVLRVLYLNNIM